MGAATNDVFRAIADATRRAILLGLSGGPRTVAEICRDFDISQPSVSAHLEVLREVGLVSVRAEGRHRHYSLDASPLREVDDWVGQMRPFWERKLDKLGRAVEARARAARKAGRRRGS